MLGDTSRRRGVGWNKLWTQKLEVSYFLDRNIPSAAQGHLMTTEISN